MGGRGSQGGTRSTYRGNSTQLFRQSQSNLANNGNGGGGSSTKNGTKGTKSSDTGGIDNGQGGNGNGNGGVATPTTDTNKQPLPPDKDLEALFQASPEYVAFDKKYENASEAQYNAKYQEALAKWIANNTGAPAPAGPATPLDKFRRINKAPANDEEFFLDIQRVNPHWDAPQLDKSTSASKKARSNVKWRVNCQRCVVTQEARDKGYDVNAVSVEEGWKPVSWDDTKGKHRLQQEGADHREIASLFDLPDGSHPQWQWATGTTAGAKVKSIEDKVLEWGEGSRGIIFVTWKKTVGNGAHVFSVRVKDGKVQYSDPQSGWTHTELTTGLETNWKISFSPASSFNGVLRVDNTEINERGTTWMRERNGLQVNLPSGAELTSKISNFDPIVQNIWTHVWQQIRSGDKIMIPQAWAQIPEAMEEARKAAAWLRRPD